MKHVRRQTTTLLGIVTLLTFAGELNAQEPQSVNFVRFHRLGKAEAALETGVGRYRHPVTRCQFSLVGAVHVAESDYFRAVQRELDSQDLVLYEMVGAPGEERGEELAQLKEHLSSGLQYLKENQTAQLKEMKVFLLPAVGPRHGC